MSDAWEGQTLTWRCEFRDVDGALKDPSTVTFTYTRDYLDADGVTVLSDAPVAVTWATNPSMKVSTGIFEWSVATTSKPGNWVGTWRSTGVPQAASPDIEQRVLDSRLAS
jgi:hypothetical protein